MLPTGTVTFFFSDLEASTRLWEAHPGAMPAALARHDALLREAIEAHGGAVVKQTGDGLHAAFASAAAAAEAAVAAQHVANERVADVGEVAADLMGAAGIKLNLKAADTFIGISKLSVGENFISGNYFNSISRLCILDKNPAFSFVLFKIRRQDIFSFFHFPLYKALVIFADFAAFHLFKHHMKSRIVFCHHNKTPGVAVKPVAKRRGKVGIFFIFALYLKVILYKINKGIFSLCPVGMHGYTLLFVYNERIAVFISY